MQIQLEAPGICKVSHANGTDRVYSNSKLSHVNEPEFINRASIISARPTPVKIQLDEPGKCKVSLANEAGNDRSRSIRMMQDRESELDFNRVSLSSRPIKIQLDEPAKCRVSLANEAGNTSRFGFGLDRTLSVFNNSEYNRSRQEFSPAKFKVMNASTPAYDRENELCYAKAPDYIYEVEYVLAAPSYSEINKPDRLNDKQEKEKKRRKGLCWCCCCLPECCIFILISICAVLLLIGIAIGLGLGIKYLHPELYGGTCTTNSDCWTISDYGFVCTNGTCSCKDMAYYSSDKYSCLAKRSFLETCDQTAVCDTNKDLECSNSICVCKGDVKWTGISCELSTYNETCNATNQCEMSVGLSCISSICTCSNGFFWNGTFCDKLKTFGENCIGDFSCNQTQLLNCPLQAGQRTCNCQNLFSYFDTTAQMCLNQKTSNESCLNAIECRQDLGLNCTANGKCECDNRFYWSSTNNSCILSSTINETCSIPNVPCDVTQYLVCGVNNVCTCQSTHYWNSATCTLKKDYNETCLDTLECNDNIGLVCSGFVCLCSNTSYFYNGTQCRVLRDYMEPCSATAECYTPGQLSCKNNSCDCPLPISQRMYWVPAYQDCRILPKNCKEIQAADPSAVSGIFYLASSVGLLEAYCEMVIDGGGYTFVPWQSLSASTSMLSDIYTDKTKILFRLISRTDNQVQPYVLTKQLSQFSNIPIAIQENSWSGYTRPMNLNAGSYVFIGFLPAANANVSGVRQGFIANGVNITFTNCDGNANSYFALFANQNPTNPSGYSIASGVLNSWKAEAIAHPLGTFMPNGYFYYGEMHQGGCGGYAQTDRWSDYFGVAFGMI